jgi:hypothetical protein
VFETRQRLALSQQSLLLLRSFDILNSHSHFSIPSSPYAYFTHMHMCARAHTHTQPRHVSTYLVFSSTVAAAAELTTCAATTNANTRDSMQGGSPSNDEEGRGGAAGLPHSVLAALLEDPVHVLTAGTPYQDHAYHEVHIVIHDSRLVYACVCVWVCARV